MTILVEECTDKFSLHRVTVRGTKDEIIAYAALMCLEIDGSTEILSEGGVSTVDLIRPIKLTEYSFGFKVDSSAFESEIGKLLTIVKNDQRHPG